MPKLIHFPAKASVPSKCFTDGTLLQWRTASSGLLVQIGDEWSIITGQLPNEALDYGWTKMIHPEDRDRMLRSWYCSQLNIMPFLCDFRLLTVSGSFVDARSTAEPVFNLEGQISHWQGESLVSVVIPCRLINMRQ